MFIGIIIKNIKICLERTKLAPFVGLLLVLVVMQISCISYNPEEYEQISGNSSNYPTVSGSGGFFGDLTGVLVPLEGLIAIRNVGRNIVVDQYQSEDPLSALEGERADPNSQELPFGL